MKRSLSIISLLVYVFLYTPIILLIINSFNSNRFALKWDQFTFKWYEQLFQNDSLIQAAANSILIAITSATFATIIGLLISTALFKYNFNGKKLIKSSLFIIMMSPDIILAISFLGLFLLIGLPLGFLSLFVAHTTFCLPFVVITIYSRLSSFDKKVIEAAQDLGASEFTVFRKIITPLTKSSIISSWLLSFTLSLDDVIVSSFVTSPTYQVLPVKIYSMVRVGVSPQVNALATILLFTSLLLIFLSQLINKKTNKI